MSQARDFADSFSAVSTGRRNLIINGAMQVAQRGTSAVDATSGGAYRVDRFKAFASGGGVFTTEQSSTVPNNEFAYSNKLTVTTADSSISSSDYYAFNQDIEGYNIVQTGYGTSDAKKLTLSFWVRSSVTGTYCVTAYNSDGSRGYLNTFSISTADTWIKVKLSWDGDTGGTWLKTNGKGITLRFDLGGGSSGHGTADQWTTSGTFAANRTSSAVDWIATDNATFYITGVQLELGNSASPFEHRSHAEELQLAKRYYQEYENPTLRGVINLTSGGARMGMMLPVEMRTNPTLSVESTGSSGHFAIYDGTTGNNAFSSFSATYLKPFRIEMDCSATSSNLVIGRAAVCYDSTVYRTKFKISAEL